MFNNKNGLGDPRTLQVDKMRFPSVAKLPPINAALDIFPIGSTVTLRNSDVVQSAMEQLWRESYKQYCNGKAGATVRRSGDRRGTLVVCMHDNTEFSLPTWALSIAAPIPSQGDRAV
eukprot:gene19748-998_t